MRSEWRFAETCTGTITILQNAEHIYIMGVRRMFPVASYLTYSLSQTRKRVIMVDGVGGLYKHQAAERRQGDDGD